MKKIYLYCLFLFSALFVFSQEETIFTIHSDIDSTSAVSAYHSYSFTATAATGTITDYYWEYRIKRKNAAPEVVKTSTASSFTIHPLSWIKDEYEINSDGDITAEIFLKGKVNNTENEARCDVYLDRKPADIDHSFKIIGIDQWYYKIEVTLYAAGAESFSMIVTDWEEELTILKDYPETDSIKVNTFSLMYDSRILFSFVASNQYGSKRKEIMLPPVLYQPTSTSTIYTSNVFKYEVWNQQGHFIKEVYSEEEIYNGTFGHGFYIVKELDKNNQLLNARKIIIHSNP